MAYGISYAPNPLLGELKNRIARVESGGRYDALGPEITRKRGTDRAYGKYQVMGANVPAWTEQALGRPLTPMEFLRSPEAQEKVFENQMSRNLQKYGTLEDAASVWFSGRPLAQAQKAGARDVNMGVGDYVNKVMGGLKPQGGVQVAGEYDDLYKRMDEQLGLGQPSAAPVAPKMVTPGEYDELYKRMDEQLAAQPAPVVTKLQPRVPAPEPDWSMAKGFAHGASLGWLPNVEAMYETGNIPYVKESAPGPYEQRVKEIQEARKQYGEMYPVRSGIAEVAGSLAPMAAGMGLGGMAARAGAGAIEAAVPEIAPTVQTAMRIMGGEAGRPVYQAGQKIAEAMPGLPGRAARLGSTAIYGAGQGAGTAFMGQKLAPEDMPLSEQMRNSMIFGSIAAPLTRAMFGAKEGGRFAPDITKNLREQAQAWNTEFPGLNVRAGQVAKGAAHEYDLANISQAMNEQQLRVFNEHLKNVVRAELTPEGVEGIKRTIGTEMGRVTQGLAPMQPDAPLNTQLSQIYAMADGEADHVIRNQVLIALRDVYNKVYAQGGMPASAVQNLFESGSVLDRQLAGTPNAIKQKYGNLMRDAIGDFFSRKYPKREQMWDALRAGYRDASTLEYIVNESGVVSPQEVSKAVATQGSRTALKRLAKAGAYLPGSNIRGEAVSEGKHIPIWKRALTYWPTYGIAASPAGYALNAFAPNLLQKIPLLAQYDPMAISGAGIGAALTKMGMDATANMLLARPDVNAQLLAGATSARPGQLVANPLRGAVGFFPERFGQAPERKKK